MKIHVIKDGKVSKQTYTDIASLLNAIPGSIQFTFNTKDIIQLSDEETSTKKDTISESDFNISKSHLAVKKSTYDSFRSYTFPWQRNVFSWDSIFKQCNKFRSSNRINKKEFVILLTEESNDMNWFASLDEKMPFNGFVQTSDWNYFIKCNEAFPVAYEIIALALRKYMFDSYDELKDHLHKNPIGCINDYCEQKRDIILKLRTADICGDCLNKLKNKLRNDDLVHAIQIIESLRLKMLFSQNFKQEAPLSKIVVNQFQRSITFTDYGNLVVQFTPLEMTLYMLYLRHPEGIGLSFLNQHLNEMYKIYEEISNVGSLNEMRNRIDVLGDITSESATQKISKIKLKMLNALGSGIAKNYFIGGEIGEPKTILITRSMVSFTS